MSAAWQDAFAGKSVFITGHTGFKGSWLSIWLHRLGARVTGYSLKPPTEPNNFTLSRVRELLAGHHEGDVRDVTHLEQALHAAEPDVVFHLAAQALVREGYAQPRDTFDVNFMGTVNVLDVVRRRGRPCVIAVVTSDKCYENRPRAGGYRESDPIGGDDPYSASKGAAELVTAAYRRSFFPPDQMATHGVKLASARAGNVIGGGDWAADRIIADAARSLGAREPVLVRNPHAIRPWQHVLDPLNGYLMLAGRMLATDEPVWCDAWNFGPYGDDDIAVRELVEQFIADWGQGAWQDASDPRQPAEADVLRLSVDKAMQTLNWRPRLGLEEAVRRTARWYRRYYVDGQTDMRPACLDDIAAYEAAEQASPS